MKKKLLVICGPTASGKTALAIKLARQFNGELISADSRQVYQGMDIGTGKDLSRNSKFQIPNSKLKLKTKNHKIGYYLIQKIPVWLLDVVKPDYRFSAGDYVMAARPVIQDIWQRGKLAIVVGGTGFYIKALIGGMETLGVEPDWELRQKLFNCSIVQLFNCLKKADPERLKKMNQSDRNNPRRLIRAIEVARKIKNLKFKIKNCNLKFKIDKLLMIGLKAPRAVLDQRINQRVKERVKQGAAEEIKRLLALGYDWDNSVLGETIGYQQFRLYFEDRINLAEAVKKWQTAEHQYARRQMTWFKKTLRQTSAVSSAESAQGEWFDITDDAWQKKVVKLIKTWYSKINAEKS